VLINPSWKNSYVFVVLVAFAIGVLTVAVSVAVDWLLHGRGLVEGWQVFGSGTYVYASDLLAALAAGTVSGIALGRLQARRRELLARMQAVDDVNHHVRNALTAVALSAALHDDAELNERVRDAAERIDWVLRDVLPNAVNGGRAGSEGSRWSEGRYLSGGPIK
jgi:hypothetical protein